MENSQELVEKHVYQVLWWNVWQHVMQLCHSTIGDCQPPILSPSDVKEHLINSHIKLQIQQKHSRKFVFNHFWTYVFSEISFFGLTYPFWRGGGKAQCLKKIYWPHAIFNILGLMTCGNGKMAELYTTVTFGLLLIMRRDSEDAKGIRMV